MTFNIVSSLKMHGLLLAEVQYPLDFWRADAVGTHAMYSTTIFEEFVAGLFGEVCKVESTDTVCKPSSFVKCFIDMLKGVVVTLQLPSYSSVELFDLLYSDVH
jgi:hypothetical protein